MTLKSDAKFKEKLTCSFKHDIRNLVNFHPTTQKSQNFTLSDFFFCPKYKGLSWKIQRSYLSWHWTVMQNLKKNWFVPSKMTRIWWVWIRALEMLKNLHFDWFLLCKVFNVWPKLAWGIGWTFIKAHQSLKICTLMGCFG